MRFIAPLVLISLLLSGCTGIPADAADFGDTVTIRYTAVDAEGNPVAWSLKSQQTQVVEGVEVYRGASLQSTLAQRLGTLPVDLLAILTNQTGATKEFVPKADIMAYFHGNDLVERFTLEATFPLGKGNSGLGVEVERAIRGKMANDTFTLTTKDDPTRDYFKTQTAERMLGPNEVSRTVTRQEFSQFGAPASVGSRFPFAIFEAEVTNVNDQTVTFQVLVDEGVTTDVQAVGARVEVDLEGSVWWYRLEPVVGSTFTITPPSFFQPNTPLGLEPGLYKTHGKDGDLLVYKMYPGQDADLIGGELTFHIEIVSIDKRVSSPVDGNWTRRDASALRTGTDPQTVVFDPHAGSSEIHEPADDGHDDHDHGDGHAH